MKLYNLLKKDEILEASVDLNTEIEAISTDSRRTVKNSVYAAIRGEKRDGNDYIGEAIKNGASVIVTEDREALKSFPCVLVKSVRSVVAKMYARYYGLPDKNARIIAVTGTNGKSTVSYYIYNILRSAGNSVGLISTVECLINGEAVDLGGGGAVCDIASAMTTPDPEKLYGVLNEMKSRGVEYVVLETSSHALDQCRLDGIEIDVGVFTNMSSEHIDYHKTMENYFLAKERLFKKAHRGIVNIDDFYGERIKEANENIYSFSMNKNADFRASDIRYTDDGLSFVFENGEKTKIETKMIGKHNVYNASLACAVANLLGISNEKISEGILKTRVRGRLEKFASNIYIDYAHTPTAIEASLSAVRQKEKGKRIIALFGCGGDRDKSKRAEIGKIASILADCLIITSDNPRNEEPTEIIKDILAGVDRQRLHIVIPSRRDAISYGVRILKENDVLVLLGKGHEAYEIDKSGKHYFDERVILSEVIRNDKNKAEDGK